jgi:hypothetical protein
LTLVDVTGGRLLRYAVSGESLEAITRPGLGPLEFTHPTRLLGTDDGYLLCENSERLIWFDRAFRPLRSVDFRGETAGNSPLDVSDAALLGGGKEMVALATAKRNGAWWQGFVRLNLDPLEIVEFVREVSTDSPADLMYRLNRPVIAVAGGAAYALSFSQPPALVRLTPPHETLKAFPAGFAALPTTSQRQGGAGAAAVLFGSLEAASYPVALYGSGKYLYLLTRKPRAGGGTLWQVTQIDPARDALVRTLTLPTEANHLDLAPGPRHWALVEKGPVVRAGAQRIGPVALVPSKWIEDPTESRLAGAQTVECN